MEEHINRTILDNFANNCENMEIKKTTHPQGVLRGVENGNLQFLSIHSRDQEYIDHTLLGPEYITNTLPNSFIIDLMEQQDSPGQTASDCTIASLSTNEAFPSEAQLHTILQFVNRQGQIRTQTNISGESLNDNLIHQADKDIVDSDFMAMHGNLLNEPNFKIFCSQQSTIQEALGAEINVSPIQNLPVVQPALTSIQWLKKESHEEHVEEIPEMVGLLSGTAKKILPHKKRISKKLKIMDKLDEPYPINEEIVSHSDRLVIANAAQFECELCGFISESQVQFFSHLKDHYEPITQHEVKSETQNVPPSSIVDTGDKTVIEETNASQSTVVADQVFTEVELNFDNFSEVVGLSTQHQHVPDNPADQPEIKILNSSVIAKCMAYVVETKDTPQTEDTTHEVEFSDTEDMLEGIRGVVDKVSVDDTSDDLDMQPTSLSKEPWFANSAFSGLAFKEESINNESFQTVPDLIPIQAIPNNVSDGTETPSGSNAVTDEFTNDCNKDQIPDSNEFNMQRKRGRPKGSKKNKKKKGKMEDDNSNEIEDNNKRRYICTKCNREFNSCNALKYHDLSHTGKRPHQCDVCGKSFFAQSALKAHLRVHTNDRPYECVECNSKFRQWSDLKYHIESLHSDEKNHQCEFCGKAFSRRYSLVIHRRIHTRERDYKCEFCPKTFRAGSYLQNHRKIHTGEKPYECESCGKKFRISSDLRRHHRTHDRGRKALALKNSSGSVNKPVLQSAELNEVKPNEVPLEMDPEKESKNGLLLLNEVKPNEVSLEMDYQKESKNGLILLDTMTSEIDHIFKTEDAFVT